MSKSIVVLVDVSLGIGRAAAEKFAKRGCQVFDTVRNIAKTPPWPVRLNVRFWLQIADMSARPYPLLTKE